MTTALKNGSTIGITEMEQHKEPLTNFVAYKTSDIFEKEKNTWAR